MTKELPANRPVSRTVKYHFAKLVFRSLLFLIALGLYIYDRCHDTDSVFAGLEKISSVLWIIWSIFIVEMIFRLFPARIESMGCQKQFARNYQPQKDLTEKPKLHSGLSTFAVAAAWIALNGLIGVLYFLHLIDAGILLLISLAYSVCDMICILFFCPFQTWFMKNKCCTTCRIYNWDYAMMFTPLVYVWNVYTLTLVLMSVILLVKWEVLVHTHPERFLEETNACLSCGRCREKLCHHKKQLRGFLKKNRAVLQLGGNVLFQTRQEIKKAVSKVKRH